MKSNTRIIEVECISCKTKHSLTCTESELYAYNQGVAVQRAFPNMPPDDRELLISHMCGSCFDKLYD